MEVKNLQRSRSKLLQRVLRHSLTYTSGTFQQQSVFLFSFFALNARLLVDYRVRVLAV